MHTASFLRDRVVLTRGLFSSFFKCTLGSFAVLAVQLQLFINLLKLCVQNESFRGSWQGCGHCLSTCRTLFSLQKAKLGESDTSAIRNKSRDLFFYANTCISLCWSTSRQQSGLALCLFTLHALVFQSTAVEMKAGKRWKRNIHLVLSPTIPLSVPGLCHPPLPLPISLCSPLFVSSR